MRQQVRRSPGKFSSALLHGTQFQTFQEHREMAKAARALKKFRAASNLSIQQATELDSMKQKAREIYDHLAANDAFDKPDRVVYSKVEKTHIKLTPGDHVYRPMQNAFGYTHHGVYIGNGYVVDVGGLVLDFGKSSSWCHVANKQMRGKIMLKSLDEFALNDLPLYVRDYIENCDIMDDLGICQLKTKTASPGKLGHMMRLKCLGQDLCVDVLKLHKELIRQKQDGLPMHEPMTGVLLSKGQVQAIKNRAHQLTGIGFQPKQPRQQQQQTKSSSQTAAAAVAKRQQQGAKRRAHQLHQQRFTSTARGQQRQQQQQTSRLLSGIQ